MTGCFAFVPGSGILLCSLLYYYINIYLFFIFQTKICTRNCNFSLNLKKNMNSVGNGLHGAGTGRRLLLSHWQLSVFVSHHCEEDFQVLHLQREITSEQRLSKLSAVVSPEINCCCALSTTAVGM